MSTTGTGREEQSKKGEQEALLKKLEATRREWLEEEDDDTDKLLNHAIEVSLSQGKGWAPGEREQYLTQILDDDFIPPLFAGSQEELERSGLKEAFSSLMYDEPPARLMLRSKGKGAEAFKNGKQSKVKNIQYYREAANHYHEAFAFAQSVTPLSIEDGDLVQADTDEETYNEDELNNMKSILLANAAMAHLQLKNWGHVRSDCTQSLAFNKKNVKAWYRLAKAHQMLQEWEEAGNAIDSGLAIEPENKELFQLQRTLAEKVRKARQARALRERKRAERVARVKEVWKYCKANKIRLGRVPLVATVTDDDDENDDDESRWHSHHPHTGRLPEVIQGEWAWPCMFLYPSHHQSDFVEHLAEDEMLALRMAQMFPELEEEGDETVMPWDFNNEFVCSNLAVYFEVHCTEGEGALVHPENVELLADQASTMRFYEASRALKGDEGIEMTNLARALERKHLYKQQKAWKKKHGSLWAKPDPNPVVRVHPAMTLRDVLIDQRTVVPNFLVTFILFPENHPAHTAYLKERTCLGILQPKA
jgi:tetratricopeptide (TPR) repeat protein